MPKKTTRRRAPARSRAVARRRKSGITQNQTEVLGIGLIALGLFFAFVVYLNSDGGKVGQGVVEGLRWSVGALYYAIPPALVVAGGIVIIRPLFRSARPLKSGAICIAVALVLAFAAGTFGLGTEGVRHGNWDPAWVKQHGGMSGEALYLGISMLLGSVGAHILAVFLFFIGLLLLTGASIATVLNATRDQMQNTTARMREISNERQSRRAEVDVEEDLPPQPRKAPRKRSGVKASKQDTAEAVFVTPAPLEDVVAVPDVLTDTPIEASAAAVKEADGDDVPDDLEPEVAGVSAGLTITAGDLTPQGRLRSSVTDAPDFPWQLPKHDFLKRSGIEASRPDTADQEKTSGILVEALGHFGVKAKVIGMVTGPHITRYELKLAPGTKVAKVAQLKDDLAYALAASEIRILAPIPGKTAVGVEVPNKSRRIVHLGDVLQDPPEGWSPLTVWLGKDVAGRGIAADLAKMPHILVAGTTGAGKSGCINAMLASILLRATPHEVKMVLVDPKQVELNHYESIPHLMTPVITSPRQAATALQNLVKEMEKRYSQMSLARTRSLSELNKSKEKRGEAPLPYILCVIDELADLMMVAPADVEDSIIRLAQKARAVGIHLVLATQSPRVDVITGMIKANVPSRIAFAVSSQTDSRVILDQNGAEALLGAGDMLFSPVGSSRLQRIQGTFIDEAQIAHLTEEWRKQGEPEFHEQLLEEVVSEDSKSGAHGDGFDPDQDPLLPDAIRLVAEMQTASTSMLQRRLRLGYTRAGRLIDMLERRGVISGYEGSKPRQVLIGEGDVPRVLGALAERDKGSTVVPQTLAEVVAEDDPTETHTATIQI